MPRSLKVCVDVGDFPGSLSGGYASPCGSQPLLTVTRLAAAIFGVRAPATSDQFGLGRNRTTVTLRTILTDGDVLLLTLWSCEREIILENRSDDC